MIGDFLVVTPPDIKFLCSIALPRISIVDIVLDAYFDHVVIG